MAQFVDLIWPMVRDGAETVGNVRNHREGERIFGFSATRKQLPKEGKICYTVALEVEGVTDFGRHVRVECADGVRVHAVVAGSGEPLLLLHGHPETWLMWHRVAPRLAERFTVVMADLRGYGDSDCPPDVPDHSNFSKRTMAEDQLTLMGALGCGRFHVMGHDRGARVGYRLALDHPEAVDRLVLLDIVSTWDMYACPDPAFAKALFQWYFFTQKAPLPEHMIQASREEFFRFSLHIDRYDSGHDTSAEVFPPEVRAEYLRCYTPETIHAICEEYRAGETIDRELDRLDLEAGRKIRSETLVLWGKNGLVERFFRPLECWAKFAPRLQGEALPCGHFVPEEAPGPLLERVEPFLR